MINQQFFGVLKLLKDKYSQKSQYNLFRVLRSDSDEIRLHSRFLADILNPKGLHHHGDIFVHALLQRLEISLDGDIQVDTEYKNIDILVRTPTTAVVIENKIYAEDQPQQLQRYYETMMNEGYTDIHILYLTLDGKDPSSESVGSLKVPISNISYQTDINGWLARAIEFAARDAPLREALIQYLDLVNLLTNRVDNMEHIEQLKSLLMADDNLLSIPALNQAYEELAVDTQLAMWEMFGNKMQKTFGSLTPESLANQNNTRSRVTNYVQGRRNSKWISQMTPLEGYESTYLFVEQDHYLYFGIYCENGNDSNEFKSIAPLSKEYLSEGSIPMWAYSEPKINFKSFSAESLKYLSDRDNLDEFTQQVVDELFKMRQLVENSLN